MVVISAAICTKAGKVLVARQFMPISKMRIEGLLAAFPKLLGGGGEHTFIETDAVRYLYQPLDQLYVLLITNKQSNIMEDLDTLRLFTKLVPDYCAHNTEDAVIRNQFSLVFAFDEVVSIGTKESVTLQQIKTNLAMDSHEEKLQRIIMESKMNDAREEARRKADDIEKKKAEARTRMLDQGKIVGMGSNSMEGGPGFPAYSSSVSSGSGGGGSSYSASPPPPAAAKSPTSREEKDVPKKGPVGKGMQLGKAKRQDDIVSQINKEEAAKSAGAPTPMRTMLASAAAAQKQAQQKADDRAKKRVQVHVEEKLVVSMDREGGIKKLEVKGEVRVVIVDPDDSKLVLRTNGIKSSAIKCRLHPLLNQANWNEAGTLALKDAAKGFPVGSDNAPTILKWRLLSNSEDDVPITINFWDSVDKGRSVINCEYKAGALQLPMHDVHVLIPTKTKEPPQVTPNKTQEKDAAAQHTSFDSKQKQLVWVVEEVSAAKPHGTLEFSVPECDSDAFFPLAVHFTSPQTYSGLQITGVLDAESGRAIEHVLTTSLSVEKFLIERE